MQVAVKGLILAAGRGSRFISDGNNLPKVLQPVNGKPVISYVISALKSAGISEIAIIVGYLSDLVKNELGGGFEYVEQKELLGSGNAVRSAASLLKDFDGILVVMCGDSPMFTLETIKLLINKHFESNAHITLASAILDNPSGFGRIKRDNDGSICNVIEEKCASEKEKDSTEINGGLYSFNSKWLFDNIHKLSRNAAGEYNLTEMVSIAIKDDLIVESIECNSYEVLGINSIEQLKYIESLLNANERNNE
jgi:bifunctional UDP-N-acetylglucosamine pyrophosphorylase / glucosamine-1-phosphate N-acetyltransferase